MSDDAPTFDGLNVEPADEPDELPPAARAFIPPRVQYLAGYAVGAGLLLLGLAFLVKRTTANAKPCLQEGDLIAREMPDRWGVYLVHTPDGVVQVARIGGGSQPVVDPDLLGAPRRWEHDVAPVIEDTGPKVATDWPRTEAASTVD